MSENTELIVEVARKLSEFHKAKIGRLQDLGLREWTRAVKTVLCELGTSKENYSVFASGVDKEAGGGEWLFDVCWLRYAKKGGWLTDVMLVAECEWGNDDEIYDDFTKLMIARADLRVMIFGEMNECNDITLEMLVNGIKNFNASSNGTIDPSDLYLIAAYENNDDGFKFYRLTGNGEIKDLVP